MRVPKLLNRARQRKLAGLVGVGLAQAGVSVATALLVRRAFDGWFGETSSAAAAPWLIAGLLATGLAGAWLRLRERVQAEQLGQSYAYSVRMSLYDRMGQLDPRTLQGRSRGGNLLRFIGDLTALRQWVSQGLARLVVVGVTAGGALLALASINPMMAAAVSGVVVLGIGVALLNGRSMQLAVRESRKRRARLAANVNEKISAMPVVQVFGQVDRERTRLARQSRQLRAAMVDRARAIGRLRAIIEATTATAVVVVLAVGAHEFGAGRISAGTVVAALAVMGMLMPALRDLGRVNEYWHGYRVSLEKIGEFLSTRSQVRETRGAAVLESVKGRIEFENVRLDGLFQSLNASAEAGSVVAVVGKSTVLNLLARQIDPDAGRVLIDGQDIAGCTLASLRQTVGVVSPDLPLMRGSIERNIRYRWPQASETEVRRVCRLCGIDGMLAAMPRGARTRVVDGGSNLSLGQRQRVALARALLGNPPILLLDEADANLDAASRVIMDRVLAGYQGTVLFVTHRAERVAAADFIWHIEGGRVVQVPTRLGAGDMIGRVA